MFKAKEKKVLKHPLKSIRKFKILNKVRQLAHNIVLKKNEKTSNQVIHHMKPKSEKNFDKPKLKKKDKIVKINFLLNVPAPGIMDRESISHEPYTNWNKRQLMH